MNDENDVVAAARQIAPATMAKVSPLPPPEEVFIDWLMALPHHACIEAAARREIARIDRRNLLHADVQRLRVMLLAVAGAIQWRRPLASL
ncbi:MAG TPA: hypothetical protein VGM46_02610 [Mesorhizobium sp.]